MSKLYAFLFFTIFVVLLQNPAWSSADTRSITQTGIPTQVSSKISTPLPAESNPVKHKWAHKLADKLVASKIGKKVLALLPSFDMSWFSPLGFLLGFLLGPLGVLVAYLMKDSQSGDMLLSSLAGMLTSLLLTIAIYVIIIIASI